MAKKARKKADEEEDAFEFPPFDEGAFLAHEFEQFYATLLAFGLGVLLGAVAFLIGAVGVPPFGVLGIGIVGIVGGCYAVRALRPAAREYTRGDWASLIVLMFFGFLGIWLLLADLVAR